MQTNWPLVAKSLLLSKMYNNRLLIIFAFIYTLIKIPFCYLLVFFPQNAYNLYLNFLKLVSMKKQTESLTALLQMQGVLSFGLICFNINIYKSYLY